MKKVSIICFLIAILSISTYSQQPFSLTREANIPRSDDKLETFECELDLSAVDTVGDDILWNFSNLSLIGGKHSMGFRIDGDSLIYRTENRESFVYHLSGDSLLLNQQVAPGKRLPYQIKELWLRYPMTYNTRINGTFFADGTIDDSKRLVTAGFTESTVTARGRMITPSEDFLRNVLLIHKSRTATLDVSPYDNQHICSDSVTPEFISRGLSKDSITYRTDIWQWYAKGLRYPVVETKKIMTFYFGQKIDSVEYTVYCPPHFQKQELAPDLVNDSLWIADQSEEFSMSRSSRSLRKTPDGHDDSSGISVKNIQCEIQPTLITRGFLTVAISGDVDLMKVTVEIFSETSQMVKKRERLFDRSKTETIIVDVSDLSPGVYFVTVVIGENRFTQKVVKSETTFVY